MADKSDLSDSDASMSDLDISFRNQSLPADAAELKKSTTGSKYKQFNIEKNAWEDVERQAIRREHITVMRKMALRERQEKRTGSKRRKRPKRIATEMTTLEKEFGTIAKLNIQDGTGEPNADTRMKDGQPAGLSQREQKLARKAENRERRMNRSLTMSELNAFIDDTQMFVDRLRGYAMPGAPAERETGVSYREHLVLMRIVRKKLLTDKKITDNDVDQKMQE